MDSNQRPPPCHPLAERVKWAQQNPCNHILCIDLHSRIPLSVAARSRALVLKLGCAIVAHQSPIRIKANARKLPRPTPGCPIAAAPENPLFPVLSKCTRLKHCSRTRLWLRSPGDPTRAGSRRGRNELLDSGGRDWRLALQSGIWFFQHRGCSRQAPSHRFSYSNDLVT